MTKAELVSAIAAEENLSPSLVDRVVAATFEKIAGGLARGEHLTIIGFGRFNVTPRSARKGRNPQTGKEMLIRARKAVTFKPGRALRDAVAG